MVGPVSKDRDMHKNVDSFRGALRLPTTSAVARHRAARMPVTQERGGTYPRPFAAVSAALWEKYEGHKFVTNVEPLAAAVDAHGTLHCRRLLTMQGKLPMALRPLLGATPLYLLEEVVVDAKVSLLK